MWFSAWSQDNMKGQSSLPEDIGWTIFIVIAVIFVAIISLSLTAASRLENYGRGSNLVYSLYFVSISTEPYLVGESLSFYSIGDRQFFEHALESAVTGSLDSSSSLNVPAELKLFMEAYEFRRYIVEIRSGRKSILNLDNILRKCGSDSNNDNIPDGICVNKYNNDFTSCGIGRSEIDDADACSFYQSCCTDDSSAVPVGITVQRCGPQDAGICSKNLAPPTRRSDIFIPTCIDGRDYYPDTKNNCRDTNNGETPVCCVPITSQNLAASETAASAEIPMFFKGTSGYDKDSDSSIEVTIG